MKWQVETLDFTSMFLQGGKLERELFLRPPSVVWHRYESWKDGLNYVLCSWYKRVSHELTNLKEIVSAYDNALFLWHDATSNLIGILVMHVYDFIFCENYTFQRNVVSELKRIFKVGTQKWNLQIFRIGCLANKRWDYYHIYPTPPLGQDMTQGQFLSRV